MPKLQQPQPNQDPAFLKLLAKWDKKLKDSGFVDIEDSKFGLKTWAVSLHRGHPEALFSESRAEYTRLAGFFLHEYKFKNKLERTMWEHHTEGLTIEKTVEAMNHRKRSPKSKVHWNKVHLTLQALRKIMLATYVHNEREPE